MLTEDELRQRLEASLGLRLSNPLWQHLLDERKVARVLQGENDINWLSTEVGRIWTAAGQRGTSAEPARLLTREHRERAAQRDQELSILFARKAAQEPTVREFRRQILNDQLLKPEKLDKWLARQRNLDGPPTKWLTDVPVPDEYDVVATDSGYITNPPLTITESTTAAGSADRWLKCVTPIAVASFKTAANGIFERLRLISVELKEMFGWREAEAATFVLTGQCPSVAPIRRLGWDEYQTGLRRIALEIDVALTPREVADYYRRLRRAFLQGRLRKMSPKHMRLAAFIAERPAEEPWPDRLREWNRTHRSWSYQSEEHFRRDAQRAPQRLLASALAFGPEVEAELEARQPTVDEAELVKRDRITAQALREFAESLRKKRRPGKRKEHRILAEVVEEHAALIEERIQSVADNVSHSPSQGRKGAPSAAPDVRSRSSSRVAPRVPDGKGAAARTPKARRP